MDKNLTIEYLESDLEDVKSKLTDLIEWCESSFKYFDQCQDANQRKLKGKMPSFNEAFKMAVKDKMDFLDSV